MLGLRSEALARLRSVDPLQPHLDGFLVDENGDRVAVRNADHFSGELFDDLRRRSESQPRNQNGDGDDGMSHVDSLHITAR